MDAMETLINRRSCRAFEPRQVEREKLEQILDAGAVSRCGLSWFRTRKSASGSRG